MVDPFEFEAKYYDIIWGSTCDYPKETKLLDSVFKKYGVKSVLDVACGTGGHAIELAKLGYTVVGFDISNKILELATEKAEKESVKTRFINGDMTEFLQTLNKNEITLPFDAVICLGFSIAHLVNNELLSKALKGFHSILRENGVCIFSVRNVKKLNESIFNRLLPDTVVHENNFSLAVFAYTYRDKSNPDTLV